MQIASRTRRELAKDFDLSDHLGYAECFMALMGRLRHSDSDPLSGWATSANSLRYEINRHIVRFQGDWSTEELFEQLGTFQAPNPRFGAFIEGLASAAVLPDEHAQRRLRDRGGPGVRRVRAAGRRRGDPGAH